MVEIKIDIQFKLNHEDLEGSKIENKLVIS